MNEHITQALNEITSARRLLELPETTADQQVRQHIKAAHAYLRELVEAKETTTKTTEDTEPKTKKTKK